MPKRNENSSSVMGLLPERGSIHMAMSAVVRLLPKKLLAITGIISPNQPPNIAPQNTVEMPQ